MKMIVDWPDGLTRETLERLYNPAAPPAASYSWERDVALKALSAIAPLAVDVAPQTKVKRWCWTDKNGYSCTCLETEPHPNYAILVTFPCAPVPQRWEVTLWEHENGSRHWQIADVADAIAPDLKCWRRVGVGLIDK